MAEVRLERVSKRFEGVTAVAELDLVVADGELLALLGPSGCGKTTTLRMIASLERPTTGRIHIGGRDVTDLGARERDVAMVFQDYALYPHMTVADNIGYPLKVRGRRRADIQRRVGETAEMLGLGALLARRPAQLSGGQQQRVAVARALVSEPTALLLDEPLSNLDAKLRLEARGFLKNFQRRLGVTTVYVTHDQAEAMALADRIAIMDQGRLLQVGGPLDVYRRPADTFVAGFIGSPPMNLIACRVAPDGLMTRGGARLAPAWPEAFRPGDRLLAGVRPEHLRIAVGDGGLPAEVYAVEPLGSESLVRVRAGEELLVVRLFGDEVPALRVGDRVGVEVDMARAVFYPDLG